MIHPFTFRPGTIDETVFTSINIHNEYHLPDAFEPDDIVVDIGMHIGSFCYAVLQRGARHVYGFEPGKENYELAVSNLRSFEERTHLYNKAVWRSDQDVDRLSFTIDRANTAGGSVIWENGNDEVAAIAFDELIRDLTQDGIRRVRLLKIDCEGSEFPILLTSGMLHLIDTICGEFHEFGGQYETIPIPEHARVAGFDRFTMADLTNILQQAGFTVTSVRHGPSNIGMFYATRKLEQTTSTAFNQYPNARLRPELLAILACPACESPDLKHIVENDEEQSLVCARCGARYEFEYGIPLLYKDDALWAPKRREAAGWVSLWKELGHYQADSPLIMDLPFLPDEPWATVARFFKAALPEMNLRGDERVLDIGAGQAWAAQRFAERGCHAVAIDVCADPLFGLGRAWERMERAGVCFDLAVGDGEQLPFQAGTFDWVFASASLHHFDHLDRLFRNIFRVLRPGGRLIAIGEPLTSIFQAEHDAPGIEREKAHGIIERRRRFYDYGWHIWRAGFRHIHVEDLQTLEKTNADLYPWMDLERYAIERRPLLVTTLTSLARAWPMLRLPRPFALPLLLTLRDNGLLLLNAQKPQ
jgi:FkbM family methyltransferase